METVGTTKKLLQWVAEVSLLQINVLPRLVKKCTLSNLPIQSIGCVTLPA